LINNIFFPLQTAVEYIKLLNKRKVSLLVDVRSLKNEVDELQKRIESQKTNGVKL